MQEITHKLLNEDRCFAFPVENFFVTFKEIYLLTAPQSLIPIVYFTYHFDWQICLYL